MDETRTPTKTDRDPRLRSLRLDLPRDIRVALEDACDAELRSPTQEAEVLLREALRTRGYLGGDKLGGQP